MKSNSLINGTKIGNTIRTIGTHSKGQPNKKITAISIAKITYLLTSKFNKNSVNKDGVPNFEKTAPKKFDAATKNIINAVISKVLIKEFFKVFKVNFLYAKASNKDPIAPIPAPSVGVAKPNNILPRAKNTNPAGGTNPKKNSTQTLPILFGCIFFGKIGPSFGSK